MYDKEQVKLPHKMTVRHCIHNTVHTSNSDKDALIISCQNYSKYVDCEIFGRGRPLNNEQLTGVHMDSDTWHISKIMSKTAK